MNKKIIKDDFVRTFNKQKWDELQTVKHSRENQPDGEAEKVVFRLMEMFDFDCFKYGDNDGISKQKAKAFLIRHKKDILKMKIPPTSYSGLLAGTFNFLAQNEKESKK